MGSDGDGREGTGERRKRRNRRKKEEKEQEKEGREELARIWERRRGNLLQFEKGKLRKL